MSQNRTAIVAFLNTGLGLWLLSTVAVGLVSTGYGLLSAHLKERSEKETRIARLHVEVLQRIVQISGPLDNISDADGFDPAKPNAEIAAAVHSLLLPPSASRDKKYPVYAAFDEYRERPLVSLIVEISFLIGPQRAKKLTPNVEQLTSLTPEKLGNMSLKEIEKLFKDMFDSSYWREVGATL